MERVDKGDRREKVVELRRGGERGGGEAPLGSACLFGTSWRAEPLMCVVMRTSCFWDSHITDAYYFVSTHSSGSSVSQQMYEIVSRMAHTLLCMVGKGGPANECHRSCSSATAISLLDYFTHGPETRNEL